MNVEQQGFQSGRVAASENNKKYAVTCHMSTVVWRRLEMVHMRVYVSRKSY